MKRLLTILIAVLALGTGGIVGRRIYLNYLLSGQEVTHERLVETATGGQPHHDPIQYRAKDARSAIVEPEFVSADQARIAGGTKGIGVSVDGDSRFYPLYILQYHQVVNDVCGDKAVACSY